MWLLLYHGSWTNGRDTSIVYTLSRQFDHELHLILAGPPTKKCHDNEANINTRTVTLLAQVMWLLLYHGSWTNGRDTSIVYTISRQFDHELHLIWAGPPTKKCHDNEANINTRTVTLLAQVMWLLLYHGSWTNGRDPSILETLTRQFDHELHYFKFGITQKRHYELQHIITSTVTLRTHNSCGSSCIIAHGKMEGIHLLFILFQDSLTMNYI
jgi:hypothetical protein